MKVRNGTKTYDIRFRYTTEGPPPKELLEEIESLTDDVRDAQALLEDALQELRLYGQVSTEVSIKDETTGVELTGVTWKHPKDNHCRATARAQALRAATGSMADPQARADIYTAWMNRPDGNGRL